MTDNTNPLNPVTPIFNGAVLSTASNRLPVDATLTGATGSTFVVTQTTANNLNAAVGVDSAKLIDSVNNVALTPLFAKIAYTNSGSTAAGTVIAAVTGKQLRVIQWIATVSATANFKWQSHVSPTDLTGLFVAAGAGGGAGGAWNPNGHFQTVTGEALDINISAASTIGGSLVYVTV